VTATVRLDTVEDAIAAVKSGRPVVVMDDEDRENEGDLIFASELATPELVAFMVRYTSGYICVAVTEADADRLDLPPMFRVNQDRRGTAYTVTVDAREGVSTGISASDRAHTIRLLASPETDSTDLARPGHIVPLRARTAACCAAPATPRPPSTSRCSPGCAPRARCARWSARRTRSAWPAATSCGSSPTSTTCA
jgi:3,4-dihydroxy 2-butanone 4-phosphate synthase/GTP cyclohydrolase II